MFLQKVVIWRLWERPSTKWKSSLFSTSRAGTSCSFFHCSWQFCIVNNFWTKTKRSTYTVCQWYLSKLLVYTETFVYFIIVGFVTYSARFRHFKYQYNTPNLFYFNKFTVLDHKQSFAESHIIVTRVLQGLIFANYTHNSFEI